MLAGIESRPTPSPRTDRFKEVGSKTEAQLISAALLHFTSLGPKTNIPHFL